MQHWNIFCVISYAHFEIKYIICVQEQLVKKSITLEGKVWVAALKLVNTKSFAFL